MACAEVGKGFPVIVWLYWSIRQEKFPPSNKGALHKLSEVAKKMNIHVEMITEDDAMRLLEFDALVYPYDDITESLYIPFVTVGCTKRNGCY